jgi:hypothetical protein
MRAVLRRFYGEEGDAGLVGELLDAVERLTSAG